MQEIKQNFRVGDIVTLNSGGNLMTIASLDFNLRPVTVKFDIFTGFVFCAWFLDETLQKEKFNQDCLKLLDK